MLNRQRKTLFLDRDGTVIVEQNYLNDPQKVVLEYGAAMGIRRFSQRGFRVVIVTNQSGIGRGLIEVGRLAMINARISSLLAEEGALINEWYHCPHIPADRCLCRKPLPGMLDAQNSMHPVDWESSIMVGDKPSDVKTALARGMRGFLVTTGHGEKFRGWALKNDVSIVANLAELADLLFRDSAA